MPNVEDNQEGTAAFSAGDLETVLSILDDDTERFLTGNSTISDTYRGKAEVTELFGKLGEKNFTIAPSRFLADDDVVVVLAIVTASGESAPQADVYSFCDGKIVKAQSFADTPCSNGSTARSSRIATPCRTSTGGRACGELGVWVPHTAIDHRHRSHHCPRGQVHSVLSIKDTVTRASSSRELVNCTAVGDETG